MAEKKQKKVPSAKTELEKAAEESDHQQYVLRLFVAGATSRSEQAIRNVRALCEKHLAGRFELDVVDIYQQPELAKGEQIIAAPTLVKKLPEPLRRLIGNMLQEEKFLVGMDIRPKTV
jgi:circadian clock protein KaiB